MSTIISSSHTLKSLHGLPLTTSVLKFLTTSVVNNGVSVDSSNRPTVKLDSSMEERVLNGKTIGRYSFPCIFPPEKISKIIEKTIKTGDYEKIGNNLEKYVATGHKISRYMSSRSLPLDARNLRIKQEQFRDKVHRKMKKEIHSLDMEDEESLLEFKKRAEERVEKYLSTAQGNWKPIHFDFICSWSYLLGGCTAYDYATAKVVLDRLFRQDPLFKPQTHLDFGSGVGTVSWILEEHFGPLKESFLVDTSPNMNDIARILRPATSSNSGNFYRLHFPAKEDLKYDMVTAASALIELETGELRLTIIDSLWRRVEEQGYLVLIERGTNAGYQIIAEARDYLLKIMSMTDNDRGVLIAPCPHDYVCPRYIKDTIPCNFDVKYKNFGIQSFPNVLRESVYKDRFCYLIFQKTKQPNLKSKRWPRVVKHQKCTRNTIICELCTAEGSLEEILVHRRDKSLYRYTKQIHNGDQYKAHLFKDKSSYINNNNDQI